MMGDYNLDFFTSLEREKLETVILPYGFSVACPIFQHVFVKLRKRTLIIF